MLFVFGLAYALYWQKVSPIQYNGDSDSYLSIGRMLLGHVGAIFRTPGYPILLVLTGAIIPGTFTFLLFIQALLAAFIPVIIYQILRPCGQKIAILTALMAVLSGTTTVHTSQIMTEPLFIFLLFLGLYIAIRLVRDDGTSPKLFYLLALTFAVLDSVRPFAWLIFWPLLVLATYFLWHQQRLIHLWRNVVGSTLLFIALMSSWTLVDDVLFSFGARYSPVLSLKSTADNFLEIYLYDLPFYEAYFNPWKQRVENSNKESRLFGTLINQPAMREVRNIVLQEINKNGVNSFQDSSVYSYQLFGKYVNHTKDLVDRMFIAPNYAYAKYINSAVEQAIPKEKRLLLYYAAAKELGFNWPKRWLNLWRMNPLFPLIGPSHGNSSQQFLLAYTSLRHYLPNPEANNYHSLIAAKNGPATRLLFTILTEGLRDHSELWLDSDNLFTPFIDEPEDLIEFMVANPNQQYAWDITRMLWDLMGYHTMSELLAKVSSETIASHPTPRILRIWDNILMVAAGPGYIAFDTLGPQLGKVEIYEYLETPQLTDREKKELRSTKNRYLDNYLKWRAPIQWSYFLFYLLKPFFLLTSIMSLITLWANRQTIAVPIILMLPYFISIIVYGTWFTALPRYTDPTLLLPLIVTSMAIPDYLHIWRKRKETKPPLSSV